MRSAHSDQPGLVPSLISFHCPHVQISGPKKPIEHTAKTDWTNIHADLIIHNLGAQPSGGFVMVKLVRHEQDDYFWATGAVAKLLERPLCIREVVGSIPDRVIPKT